MRSMKHLAPFAARSAALTLLALAALIGAGCATTGDASDESEPTLIEPTTPAAETAAELADAAPMTQEGSKQEEGEVPLPVAETEPPAEAPKEIIVQGSRARHDTIHDLVAEG